MENEIYTSERKILERFQITDEQAVTLLLDAGYKSVPEARDACGRDLGYRIRFLHRQAEWRALAPTREEFESLVHTVIKLGEDKPPKGK